MPYAVYRIQTNNLSALGINAPLGDIAEFDPRLVADYDPQLVFDGRFHSFGKEPHDVQMDLYAFIAKARKEMLDSRIPDDLELMYNHEVKLFDGIKVPEGFQNEQIGVLNVIMDNEHTELARAFHDVRLEIIYILDEETEHMVDEALEIVRDMHVTQALARASNPFKSVADLVGKIHDVKKAAVRCVSPMFANNPEDCRAMLAHAIEAYHTLHQSMRFITLAKDNKEAN